VSEEITASTISKLFEDQNIDCAGSRLSKNKMLWELAQEAALLRHCFERGRPIVRQAQKKIETYLRGLLDEIPAVIQTDVEMAKFQSHHGESTLAADEQRKHLIVLQEAALNVMKHGIGWSVIPSIEMWHDYAVPLADDFRKAMHATDPSLNLQISNEGPIVRFLEAVIPIISEETPGRAAIARYLQREKTERGNTTRMPANRIIKHHFGR